MPKIRKGKFTTKFWTKTPNPKRENFMTSADQVFVCRVCLGSFRDSCRSIWEPHREGTIAQYMVSIANIQPREDDTLPSSICEPCLHELDGAVDWKFKCEHSDFYLQQSAAQLADAKPSIGDVKREPECVLEAGGNWVPLADEEVPVKLEPNAQRPASKAAQEQQSQCNDCGEVFKTKCKLRVHWKKAHKPKEYVCDKCKRCLKSEESYNKHVNAQKPCLDPEADVTIEGIGKGRIFKCNQCAYTTKKLKYVEVHCRTHTGIKLFECESCPGKKYTQLSGLIHHRLYYHKECEVDMTCYVCGKHLKGKAKFSAHIRTHREGKYQCDVCKKYVKTKRSLEEHVNRHLNVKPYKCDVCGRSFTAKGNMEFHKKLKHELVVKKYPCDICGFQLSRSKHLAQHKLKHNSMNCACRHCGKFFNCSLKLMAHMKFHSNMKDYSCPVCQKSFQTIDSVYRHLKEKHGELLTKSVDTHPLKAEEHVVVEEVEIEYNTL